MIPATPTPRQTQSYLRALFQERGIQPKNKLGQNFLVDLNLIDLVIRAAEVTKDDLVLEVGSGTGGLTMRLVDLAGGLVSAEIDKGFAELSADLVATHFRLYATGRTPAGVRPETCRLVHADALAGKNTLNPAVVDPVRELLAAHPDLKRVKLVANLPYAVAVPVMANLLLTDLPVERMVVMVQWEIAERLLAVPSSKDYASLAVLVQSLGEVTLVRKVPPTSFWPAPAVDSAIVLIKFDPAKRAVVGDVPRFRAFLRDLYVHRRKSLRAALSGMPSGRMDKAEVDARLAAAGIDGTARAESLDVEQHLRLCRAFAAEG